VAIKIEDGHYSLSKSVKSVLRANLDSALASIGANVTDYLPDDLQGSGALLGRNVYLADDRIPPQAAQYILLSVEHTADFRVMSLGTQNSTFEVRALATVRGTTRARSGSDPSPTYEDATWQTAGLLARAVDYCLQRYLPSETGIYNVERIASARAPLDTERPNQCAYLVRWQAYVRTRNPLGES